MTTLAMSRRTLLKGAGALVVAFSMPGPLRAQTSTPPAKLAGYASVDAWLAIDPQGGVTVFSGKVELGTGVETALAQIVAEELDLPLDRIAIVQGDTARTPDQGYTTGSKTIQQGAPQLRQAAAEARRTLLALASARLGAPVERLTVADGSVAEVGSSRAVTYAELIGGRPFHTPLSKDTAAKDPGAYRIVGAPVPRVDIPAKVMGRYPYVQNLRFPGMLHGRVVHPPAPGARVADLDEGSVRGMPGLVQVVRRADFVGVVAEREEQAIRAARKLQVTWRPQAPQPGPPDLFDQMRAAPTRDVRLTSVGDVDAALGGAARSLRATYRWPFQMHASIGPSCAVADVGAGGATIWCASQGVFGLRDAVAGLLGMPAADVRVIYAEGSGCYGHNGADDVAADAALLSRTVGRPVRVQWMRHDEHGWEPKGPAMLMDVRGGLDAGGKVVGWDYAVWTPTHSTRPVGQAGNLLAGQLTGAAPKSVQVGGDRNAAHTYVFPNDRVVVRWLAQSPLRPPALRGLGGVQNTFANESFMDELAAAAGADPVEFRLRHLHDERAIAVLEAAARRVGWSPRPAAARGGAGAIARGRGVAYCQYETQNAYVAVVVDVAVERASGAVRVTRAVAAHDCGLVINPDGLTNQIEGAVIQGISRALKEEAKFTGSTVTSLDWTSYPIFTFAEVPDAIDVVLLNRPDKPAVGAGEPATCPVPAAIANAIFDATGARLRTAPFTPDRVRAALEIG